MSQEFRLRSHGSVVPFNLEVFHFQQAALTPDQRCCFCVCFLFFGRDLTMTILMMLMGVTSQAAYSESLARLVMQPVLSR